ncbi:dihydroxyacetone kinase phosphoryl donor subunit DhaM [Agrococcus casei]|uniref:Phosphocarrier protein HPr n=1 Tax=Agrococcus casei LMG 22410 TaxID=1255656 RepID=A0A1R4FSQ6_9MICO|nr:dihydroxyacetone kinase phosphoryl donor subunit DhaM [Agrococcus casei]SJM59050.1 Phosphoenolpyruvate-dihydroxyacetone phosphotransferase, subunit DhaM; DHA-specific IIA component [Agrococcus casei LMG 22410]
MSVELIIVSHSSKLAEGVVELAQQMAEDVRLHAVGGTDEGGIGTSFDRVQQAVEASGDAVVLCDLGSAVMTAESVIDFLDDDARARIRLADAPLVEGAVAAAVAAQSGGSLDEVLAAAESAAGSAEESAAGGSDEPATVVSAEADAAAADAGTVTATVVLVNESGLHARPASALTKLAATFDAEVKVNGVNAKSLLSIMALGLAKGAEVVYEADGADARAAIEALVALTEEGFGE